jgi:hypothetical protein
MDLVLVYYYILRFQEISRWSGIRKMLNNALYHRALSTCTCTVDTSTLLESLKYLLSLYNAKQKISWYLYPIIMLKKTSSTIRDHKKYATILGIMTIRQYVSLSHSICTNNSVDSDKYSSMLNTPRVAPLFFIITCIAIIIISLVQVVVQSSIIIYGYGDHECAVYNLKSTGCYMRTFQSHIVS